MSSLRKAFEAWAKDNEYDISFDLKAPCYVYVCEKTDAAWDGYKAAHEAAEAEKRQKPTAWHVKATGAFYLSAERISANDRLLGVTELYESP